MKRHKNGNGHGQGELFGNNWGNGDEGRRRKQKGMDRVARNNKEWMKEAILILHRILVPGWHGLPEEWRRPIIREIGPPTHHNCWGPLTTKAVERGLIRETGRRYYMKSKRSNGRKTDEYERPDQG